MNPLVSIIMPAYNAENFIGEAIESVVSQSLRDWELLVTDDGSTDSTCSIVEEFIERDSRVKLYYNESGKGPASARNNSIERAGGDFIAFLDSDDCWKPEKLERQLEFMERVGADFCFTDFSHINEVGFFVRKVQVPKKIDYATLLKGNVIATATVLIRRASFPDLKMPDYPRAQDFALWIKLLRQVDQGFGLNVVLSDYRVTPNIGNRRKIFALKYLYDIFTKQEGRSPIGAVVLISRMYLYRVFRYRSFR